MKKYNGTLHPLFHKRHFKKKRHYSHKVEKCKKNEKDITKSYGRKNDTFTIHHKNKNNS